MQADTRPSRCQLEWLRCLMISQHLVPRLPEEVLQALTRLGLAQPHAGGARVTLRGHQALQQAALGDAAALRVNRQA